MAKKYKKKVKREERVRKKIKDSMEKRSPDGLTIARANRPPGSLCPEAVDDLPNLSTPIIHPLPPGEEAKG